MDVIVKYGADDGKLNIMMVWIHRKNSKESMMKTTNLLRDVEEKKYTMATRNQQSDEDKY
jgi:hypothetical protein